MCGCWCDVFCVLTCLCFCECLFFAFRRVSLSAFVCQIYFVLCLDLRFSTRCHFVLLTICLKSWWKAIRSRNILFFFFNRISTVTDLFHFFVIIQELFVWFLIFLNLLNRQYISWNHVFPNDQYLSVLIEFVELGIVKVQISLYFISNLDLDSHTIITLSLILDLSSIHFISFGFVQEFEN